MRIPPGVRSSILLSDVDLERELVALTDAHTDDLFAWLGDHGATRFVNRRSRLVVDPERLLDPAAEPTEALGQGAVYTRTSDGRALRTPDPAAREALIEAFYRPYHDALDATATDLVEAFGRCTHPRLSLVPDRAPPLRARPGARSPGHLHRTGSAPYARRARGAPRGRLPRRGALGRGGPTVRRHDGPERLLRARHPPALGDDRGPPRPLHGRSDRRAIARLRGDRGRCSSARSSTPASSTELGLADRTWNGPGAALAFPGRFRSCRQGQACRCTAYGLPGAHLLS